MNLSQLFSICSLLLLVVWTLHTESSIQSPVVLNVPGYASKLLGTTRKSLYTNKNFYAFRSVYYAEKPTNTTRFLPPIPKAPYPRNEVVNATVDNVGCPQVSPRPFGDENCLSLNIYTPKLTRFSKLPVLFWIHGGSFSIGKAGPLGPERFMEQNIVLVVIQYRLGPLGWLTLGTDDVPGNAGIFDMIEALRWVKKHISNFGGDPNQVTITGGSAGGEAVAILLLTPQAKGLYHRAIADSGTSLLPPCSYTSTNDGKVAAQAIASLAGCPKSNAYKDILNCVRNIDPITLTSAYFNYSKIQVSQFNLCIAGSAPVIQTAGTQRVLEVEPKKLFTSGKYTKVPIMMGTNKQDGSFVLAQIYYGMLVPNNLLTNSTFLAKSLVPTLLRMFGYIGMNDTGNSLASAYTAKYLARTNPNNFTSMIPGLTDLCSVLWIKNATLTMANILASQGSKVYLYSFEYYGRISYYDVYWFPKPNNAIPRGVTHKDELVYLFTDPFLSPLNATEIAFSRQMLNVWTNFVKYGNPTPFGLTLPGIPKFPLFTTQRGKYLVINKYWSTAANYTNTYLVTGR